MSKYKKDELMKQTDNAEQLTLLEQLELTIDQNKGIVAERETVNEIKKNFQLLIDKLMEIKGELFKEA